MSIDFDQERLRIEKKRIEAEGRIRTRELGIREREEAREQEALRRRLSTNPAVLAAGVAAALSIQALAFHIACQAY